MDINDLKRKRSSLQLKIKEWYDKGKNAKDLVDEYHNILDELRKLGVKAEAKADYLQKEYWRDHPSGTIKTTQTTPIKETPKESKPQNIKPIQDTFILCLAWSASLQNETPEQVTKVMDYFKELGLPLIDESVGEIDKRMEHVLRYEFSGTEESFKMLKTCTQFVLDAFAKTDFEKFNIAIYGKKKKY